ncbi:lipopolysaccharide biosynthesis protein [Flavobacterium sp.]
MLKEKIAGQIKRKQIKDFGVYGFGQAINLISPLLVIPHINFVCGESGLGKVGVGFSFALILIVLVDYGSYINGTKAISINNADRNALEEKFNTIYLSKLILLIVVLVLSILIILCIPFFQKDKWQLLFSLLVVVGQFINPTWFLQGIQNFKWITIINVLSKIIYVSAVLIFIKKAEDYMYVNALLGIGSIIAGTLGFLWIYNHYSFSLKKSHLSNAVDLIKSEFSLTVSQLFFSFYQYAPIMVVSYVGGSFMAGQYRIIEQVIMIFRTYFQMFFNFIYADICRAIYNDVKTGIDNWRIKNGLNYALILLVLIVFYFTSDYILLFFKVSPENAVNLVPLFKIGLGTPIFMGVSFALKQLIFAFDKNRAYIRITIFSTIFSLMILFLLLNQIGLKGAFISTIISEIFIIIIYCLVLKSSFARTKSVVK